MSEDCLKLASEQACAHVCPALVHAVWQGPHEACTECCISSRARVHHASASGLGWTREKGTRVVDDDMKGADGKFHFKMVYPRRAAPKAAGPRDGPDRIHKR